jgi:membrane-bound serine protease (ClpP class)
MKLLILIGMVAFVVALSVAIVVALYRHKKALSTTSKILGEIGEVASALVPEGSVVVQGELWRARSRDGSTIAEERRVRVVGVDGHLLVVEVCE